MRCGPFALACAAIGAAVLTISAPSAAATPPTNEPPPSEPVPTTSIVLAGQQIPVDTGPAQLPFPLEAAPAVPEPLIPVPDGCAIPDAPTAVFEGRLDANSARAARFEVIQLRAGDLGGQMQGNLVDIRYGPNETRFLDIGTTYLVGVRPDLEQDFLVSKVVLPAPDFAGDAVIGLDDTGTSCPEVKDAVRTVLLSGQSVDTGVLSPMKQAKAGLLRALLVPLLVALGVLVILAVIKHLLVATGRSLGNLFGD